MKGPSVYMNDEAKTYEALAGSSNTFHSEECYLATSDPWEERWRKTLLISLADSSDALLIPFIHHHLYIFLLFIYFIFLFYRHTSLSSTAVRFRRLIELTPLQLLVQVKRYKTLQKKKKIRSQLSIFFFLLIILIIHIYNRN